MATSPTLTSLLNSLHTHLQSQTQLLPTLHAQLGLPSTALADELRTLEKQLMESVESQIDSRRKEVDTWMQKCETAESECLRYSKALGGTIKATESSVGEVRKELVLPKRHQMALEYQERLRQLYHTKLEQLTTLVNRINNLVRTLGREYFAQDILEPTPALGETPQDPNVKWDVTPERFSKLEKELVRSKAEVTKRINQLSTTFVQIDWLHSELGLPPPSLDDLPSSSANSRNGSLSFPSRHSYTSATAPLDPFAASTPTPSSRTRPLTPLLFQEAFHSSPETEYQRIFATFVARIEEADDESLPEGQNIHVGLENVEPTPGLLTWAVNLRSSLEDMKRRREAHIQAMYDQLEGLWRRFGVGEAEMDAFVEEHRGSTEETVKQYEEELERMLELKRERMSVFVISAREEIVRLWDDLMVGEDERADFAPIADDEHTEELLTIHENEIKRLKEERRLKAPLLASIKKYFDICEEEKELAAAASDQTRLLGRGRDPGRLLREEKMRKRVSKEKPRLERDLLVTIPAWEEEAKRPFLVHGESILHILMQTASAADQENKRKPARAGSVPPRSTTPVNSVHAYVPAKTGVVTPAVRPGTASQSVPNKRQKLGEPAPTRHERQASGGNGGHLGRAPLGSYRGGNIGPNGRVVSPSRVSGKTPKLETLPVPKPGTQHYTLGHGRVPSATSGHNLARSCGPRSASSTAGLTSSICGTKYLSGRGGNAAAGAVKKASRARRESFKPRPSIDDRDIGMSNGPGARSGRWGGHSAVREEDEGD